MRPETVAKVVGASEQLEIELGRPPSLSEIGARAGLSGSRVHRILAAAGEDTLAYREWKQAHAEPRPLPKVIWPLSAARLLAFNLRRLLADSGMSEAEFAVAVGLPGSPAVALMNLRGDYLRTHSPKWPKSGRLDAMAKALGVPRSELFREPKECHTSREVEPS